MESCENEPAVSRIPPPGRPLRVQPDCVLRVGSQRLPAAISEERGETLHVLVQGNPQFWVEDAGRLKTPGGDLAVRVFNIVRVEGDEDEADKGDSSDSAILSDRRIGTVRTFRIGLERLGAEIDSVEAELDEAKPEQAAVLKKRNVPWRSALSVVIATAVLVCVSWRHQFWAISPVQPGSNEKNGAPTETPKVEKSRDSAGTATSPLDEPDVWRLPGVLPFFRPEVAKKLDLSPSQVDAVTQLNRTTQEAIADLEKYWGSSGRWELARQRGALMNAAREVAVQLLTEPQRKLWDEMTR